MGFLVSFPYIEFIAAGIEGIQSGLEQCQILFIIWRKTACSGWSQMNTIKIN